LNRGDLCVAWAGAYIAATDLRYWMKALRGAERELDAATRLTDVNAAAKRLMRAKARA
jgi:hypothetical protein